MEIWSENLKKLKAYGKKNGNFNVPSQWKEDRILANWVENIRKRKQNLPSALRDKLIKLGFNFDYNILSDWDAMYEKLKRFYEAHGHCIINKSTPDYELLNRWIEIQRLAHTRLSPQHLSKLNKIEFEWDIRGAAYKVLWLPGFEKLRAYYEKYGTSRIEWSNKAFSVLFEWSRTQIKRYKTGSLSEDKIKLLNSIEFDWAAGRKKEELKKWLIKYEQLKAFHLKHGDCKVPHDVKSLNGLYAWMLANRTNIDRLTEDQKKKLNNLGFQWRDDIQQKKDEKWEAMYQRLNRYRKKHKHINVTIRQDRPLNRWLVAQEERASINKIRQAKLEVLGMVWKKERKQKRDAHWNKMYSELKSFKKKNGHLIVPVKDKELRLWIQTLRVYNKTLTDVQLKKLKALDFDFNWKRNDYMQLRWEKRYQELKTFSQTHGHATPSKHTGEYQSLGIWIVNQRINRDRLSTAQKKKLNELGFNWGKKK